MCDEQRKVWVMRKHQEASWVAGGGAKKWDSDAFETDITILRPERSISCPQGRTLP